MASDVGKAIQRLVADLPKTERCPICRHPAVARAIETVREHLSAHLIVHTDWWVSREGRT
jgi:hypothetical protein